MPLQTKSVEKEEISHLPAKSKVKNSPSLKQEDDVKPKQDSSKAPRTPDVGVSEGKRAKHKCPVTGCTSKEVVHLPRHLRKAHGWSDDKALSAVSQFNLRKERKRKGTRERKRRPCPVPGCPVVVKRIHNHLKGLHQFKGDDPRYKFYLQRATLEELPESYEEEVISCSSSSSLENVAVAQPKIRKIGTGATENEKEATRSHCGESLREVSHKDQTVSSDRQHHTAGDVFFCEEIGTESATEKEAEATRSYCAKSLQEVSHKDQTVSSKLQHPIAGDGPPYEETCSESESNEKREKEVKCRRNPAIHQLWLETFGKSESSDEELSPWEGDNLIGENADTPLWSLPVTPLISVKSTSSQFVSDSDYHPSEDTSSDDSKYENFSVHPSELEDISDVQKRPDSSTKKDSKNSFAENERRVDDNSRGVRYEENERNAIHSDEDSDSDIITVSDCANEKTEEVLQLFKAWLEGVDGERREEKTAKQYVAQVRSLLKTIDPENSAK